MGGPTTGRGLPQSMPSYFPAITPRRRWPTKVIEADDRPLAGAALASGDGDDLDLLTGDLPATTCPNFERRSVKIGMNAMLNGGGLRR